MQGKKPFYATPQDAEAAFYDALERADLDTMMSVWTEDEEPVCVHPRGPRLSGYAQIKASWKQIFNGGPRLKVRLSNQVNLQGLLLAVHSLHENISVAGDDTLRPTVVTTNIYLRGTLGWRMLVHHASPGPMPPDMVSESPQILH